MTSQSPDDTRGGAMRVRKPIPGEIDFSLMYFAHDAFARDLRRMAAAAATGRGGDPSVRNGWETFKRQLHTHHVAEDESIWPQLREKVTDPQDIAVLDMMEAEHGRIDPLLAQVDAALATGDAAELAAAAGEAAEALIAHMEHEEDFALPLAQTHLGSEGWNRYVKYLQKTQGLSGAAEFLPWALDGAAPATRTDVLGKLPAPVRVLCRLVFEPRYAKTPRWTGVAA
ncbi:hemerythrin domain-containing protein [Streptomyces kebangsaanensis]|uniref:hemerythrin domain-containing protein n=1 Tax=Streptomyces kebangsaanensis TaxID=864058 RepID=UPI000A8F8224|nr:hemerythrin domain-containing protein [Streptomyces kebangsaanensis]